MPAYLIVLRNEPLRDPDAMAEYKRHTSQMRPSMPIRPKVVYGSIHTLEGQAPDAVVITEFDSVAEAQAFYDSPAYQAAAPHRLRAADYTSFIVEGV